MSYISNKYDCVIIGGGMFGLYSASYMAAKGAHVAVLEKESTVFSRASKVNQSRVHRGYHYPRSLETGRKVAAYYERFCKDFDFALLKDFKQFYAIAKEDSFTTPEEYIEYCHNINIPIREVKSVNYFNEDNVVATFEVEEACFDFSKIKNHYLEQIQRIGNVDIYYGTYITSAKRGGDEYRLQTNIDSVDLIAPIVINATYNCVNEVNKIFGYSDYKIKYELCELVRCNAVNDFSNTGLTVVDGPFLSLMPFGDGRTFTLSSVNHTPIKTNYDKPQLSECEDLRRSRNGLNGRTNREKIISMTDKYFSKKVQLKYGESMFEIKPILVASERDDSRPTIITSHSQSPTYISVLAGKINTIYDLDQVLSTLK